MWDKINIWQYQQIHEVLSNDEMDTTDKEFKIVSIVNNIPETELDSLSLLEYNAIYLPTIRFIYTPIPETKPVKYCMANGKRYKFIYDVRNIPYARYIETKVFGADLVPNMHKIAATITRPQRKTWYGKWVDEKYDASKHEEYASDLLEANYLEFYSSMVFFYHVYRNWIEIFQGYMVKEMMKEGMNRLEAEKVVADLAKFLDGNIQPNLLPSLKAAKLAKLMK